MVTQPGDVASVGAVANPAGSPRVVGLDLSLTSTGIATGDGETRLLQTKFKGAARLGIIRDAVLAACLEPVPAELVVLEHYMAFRGAAIAIVEAHGVVKYALFDEGIPVAIVQPALLKKFATGKGNAPKDAMLAAAIRLYGFQGSSNDEADAWILREMGLAHLRGVILPAEYRRAALAKVTWPDV